MSLFIPSQIITRPTVLHNNPNATKRINPVLEEEEKSTKDLCTQQQQQQQQYPINMTLDVTSSYSYNLPTSMNDITPLPFQQLAIKQNNTQLLQPAINPFFTMSDMLLNPDALDDFTLQQQQKHYHDDSFGAYHAVSSRDHPYIVLSIVQNIENQIVQPRLPIPSAIINKAGTSSDIPSTTNLMHNNTITLSTPTRQNYQQNSYSKHAGDDAMCDRSPIVSNHNSSINLAPPQFATIPSVANSKHTIPRWQQVEAAKQQEYAEFIEDEQQAQIKSFGSIVKKIPDYKTSNPYSPAEYVSLGNVVGGIKPKENDNKNNNNNQYGVLFHTAQLDMSLLPNADIDNNNTAVRVEPAVIPSAVAALSIGSHSTTITGGNTPPALSRRSSVVIEDMSDCG